MCQLRIKFFMNAFYDAKIVIALLATQKPDIICVINNQTFYYYKKSINLKIEIIKMNVCVNN